MYTRRRVISCMFFTQLATLTPAARAETVSLVPSMDNSIFSADEGASNGQGDLFCGTTGGGNIQRCLLAFDVGENIPSGSTILSASLTLLLVRASAESGDQELQLHRISGAWGEGSSVATGGGGGPASEGDATWSFTFFGDESQTWGVAGGDFDSEASAGTVVGTDLTSYTWASTARTVNDVQDWLDDPAENFGWIVLGNEDQNNTARRFASRESATAADRPTLTVEFEAPAPQAGASPAVGICGLGMLGTMLMCAVGIVGMRGFRQR